MKGGGDLKLDLRSNLSGLGLDKWREILAGLFSRTLANGKKQIRTNWYHGHIYALGNSNSYFGSEGVQKLSFRA
jgi:hypothetical protein